MMRMTITPLLFLETQEMPIKWAQTRQEATEVAEWVAGKGPVTKAVQDATLRFGLTFGAALITRQYSGAFSRN